MKCFFVEGVIHALNYPPTKSQEYKRFHLYRLLDKEIPDEEGSLFRVQKKLRIDTVANRQNPLFFNPLVFLLTLKKIEALFDQTCPHCKNKNRNIYTKKFLCKVFTS